MSATAFVIMKLTTSLQSCYINTTFLDIKKKLLQTITPGVFRFCIVPICNAGESRPCLSLSRVLGGGPLCLAAFYRFTRSAAQLVGKNLGLHKDKSKTKTTRERKVKIPDGPPHIHKRFPPYTSQLMIVHIFIRKKKQS